MARQRKKELSPIVAELGMRIVRLRTEKNITQRELAFRVDIDTENLRKYEKGRQEMRISMAVKIAKALGVSLDDLT